MGLADLDRIDIVAAAPGGGETWIIVAGGGWPVADEARLVVQLLLKLAGHERHARHQTHPVAIELISADEPPAGVVALLARKGIAAWTGTGADRRPSTGRPDTSAAGADGEPDLDVLQAANARAFAYAHRLPDPPAVDGLDRLDEVLAARRAEVGLDEGEHDEDDRAFDGDLLVLAGAYAGEAIRAALGGAWRYDPEAAHMQPIHLRAGPDQGYTVNVLGKVIKFLAGGRSDSVHSLARALIEMVKRKA
jgi:hypothetical protein